LHLAPTLALVDMARRAGVRRFINTSTTSAAARMDSVDADSRGMPRAYWPHLCNVIAIENSLREFASANFTVVNPRLGLFAGRRYALGLLPVMLPRLRTHLVPWVAGGRTGIPIIDGRDIGQAFPGAVQAAGLSGYTACNIVGPGVPTVREVIGYLHKEYGYPLPHYSAPSRVAFGVAWLMELLDPVVPWEPLVTRRIIHFAARCVRRLCTRR
jgi:nucleoside-diphosphate-sugar epimerase